MQFDTKENCLEHLINIDKYTYKDGNEVGCNGTFDSVLCWEAIKANSTVTIPCPNIVGLFDVSKNLSKTCLSDGHWEGFEEDRPAGYTDFKMCYTQRVLDEINSDAINQENKIIYEIVDRIELVGLILSLICIFFSLFIFGYHKNLRCKRTKIHLNLFITIMLQSIIRLLSMLDKFLYSLYDSDVTRYESYFMRYSKLICPVMIIILEYIQTCNFMWMLNEGIYLNILLTYSIFDNSRSKFVIFFYIIGWGLPAIITCSWALAVYNQIGIDDICWMGYYKWATYWIINAFIITSLTINILCLINVIRILTSKLRENRDSSEIAQLKKSAKAAILLLPLLGITHIFEVYPNYTAPQSWTLNLIVSIIKAILVFYQGVFLSILYCFMNNEVKNAIRRHWLSKIKFKPVCCDMKRSFSSRSKDASSGNAAVAVTAVGNGTIIVNNNRMVASGKDNEKEQDKLLGNHHPTNHININRTTNIPLVRV